MTENKINEDQLNGLDLLKRAVNELNEPILQELDRHITSMCNGIAENPTKAASLSIDIKIKPMGANNKLMATMVEITKIKIPKAPPKAGFAFRGPDGGMVRRDPDQVGMFDETPDKINQETGEVNTKIGDEDTTNVSSIAQAKGKKK